MDGTDSVLPCGRRFVRSDSDRNADAGWRRFPYCNSSESTNLFDYYHHVHKDDLSSSPICSRKPNTSAHRVSLHHPLLRLRPLQYHRPDMRRSGGRRIGKSIYWTWIRSGWLKAEAGLLAYVRPMVWPIEWVLRDIVVPPLSRMDYQPFPDVDGAPNHAARVTRTCVAIAWNLCTPSPTTSVLDVFNVSNYGPLHYSIQFSALLPLALFRSAATTTCASLPTLPRGTTPLLHIMSEGTCAPASFDRAPEVCRRYGCRTENENYSFVRGEDGWSW